MEGPPQHSSDPPSPPERLEPGIPSIRVRELVKRYGGRTVVDGISFDVWPGEVFALLGPNGAGKTTTVEIAEGYRAPDHGEVRVLGMNPWRAQPALKRRVGLMLQQGGLYPQITPREALQLFATFYPAPEHPDVLLDRLGLTEVAGTRFRRLSGGQKQRLALGLAVIGKPAVVFLDEPTAAMDPQARQDTWEIVRELREGGSAVVLTTHSMEEAEQLADRVAILDRGQLVALDTPRALRGAASGEWRFSVAGVLDVNALAKALNLAPGAIRREADGSVVVSSDLTPRLIAQLSTWLAGQDIQLTELHASSQSLEEVYLRLVARRDGGQF